VHIKFTFIPGETKICSPFEELVIFGNVELSLELWTVIAGISGFDD
jgi:hypothetical protein